MRRHLRLRPVGRFLVAIARKILRNCSIRRRQCCCPVSSRYSAKDLAEQERITALENSSAFLVAIARKILRNTLVIPQDRVQVV